MALDPQEFIRRYLAHVLPTGFMRIRHYGLNGNRNKHHKLAQARAALNAPPPEPVATTPESIAAFWLRIAQLDIHQCPHCASGPMRRIGVLLPPAHAPPP